MKGLKNTGLKVNCKSGRKHIYSNGVSASIIAPNGNNYDDLNNYSAVIRLVNNNDSFLFMGDAEEVSENEITAAVQADVLKVGHHGSSSSTGQAFLDKVMPRYAVISVGENNDYGHPAKSTIDKLAKVGTTVYRTDQDGTIVFKSDGSKITINKTASIPPVDPGPGSGTKPNIVITGLDKNAELVTIKNTGANDVNLSGWVLVSVTGNQRYTFPTYTLKAGGKVTVASGGAVGDFIWTKSHIWNNSSSDPAELYDAQGNLISTFAD